MSILKPPKLKILIAFFSILPLCALSLQAVQPETVVPAMAYGFKAYGLDQGLTSTSITALIQDLDGFLWVGTEDGLFRLEGEKFRRFGTEDGIPANYIRGLSFARPSGIWVVTEDGIVLWDGGRFRPPSQFGFQGLDDCSGLPLPGGGVIISRYVYRQRFFSPADGRGLFELKNLPWGGGAYCASYDPERNLLAIALMDGLWVWDGKAWKSRQIFPASARNRAIRSVLIDRKGRYWLRQSDKLFRLDDFDAPLVEVKAPEPLSLVSEAFLVEDGFGRIWTNTATSLVWISESGEGVLGERQGLPPGGAFVFLMDSQGTLWVGGDGVFKLLGDFLWAAASRREGLQGDVTWSVCRTRDGRIWAGTSSGLAYGTPAGWRPIPGTASCQIMALREDAQGVLWVGHVPSAERPSGLMKVLPGKSEALTVPVDGAGFSGSIYGIAPGPAGSLWLGTVDPGYGGPFRGRAAFGRKTFLSPGGPRIIRASFRSQTTRPAASGWPGARERPIGTGARGRSFPRKLSATRR